MSIKASNWLLCVWFFDKILFTWTDCCLVLLLWCCCCCWTIVKTVLGATSAFALIYRQFNSPVVAICTLCMVIFCRLVVTWSWRRPDLRARTYTGPVWTRSRHREAIDRGIRISRANKEDYVKIMLWRRSGKEHRNETKECSLSVANYYCITQIASQLSVARRSESKDSSVSNSNRELLYRACDKKWTQKKCQWRGSLCSSWRIVRKLNNCCCFYLDVFHQFRSQ